MKKIIILAGLLLFLVSCQTKTIVVKRYYEPSEEFKVTIDIQTLDGTTIKEVHGALKEEIQITEEGARDFSPGKHFEFSVEGLSL